MSSTAQQHKQLAVELTGHAQGWVARCRSYLDSGSEIDLEALADTGLAGTALQQSSDVVAYGEDPLSAQLIARPWLMARALRTLTVALHDPAGQDLDTARADFVAAATACGLPIGVGVVTASSDPHPFLLLVERHLRSPLDTRGPSASVPVLFGGERLDDEGAVNTAGSAGKLRLRVLPDGPAGLYPDPATMLFFTGDDAFRQSLGQANVGCARPDRCYLWSLEDLADVPQPIPARGPSLGAAFGILLDDLAPKAVARRFRVRLLDPTAAVTATLGADKTLGAVAGYDKKITAAVEKKLRVVVSDDGYPHARQAPGADQAGLRHAGTLSEAVREVRRRRNPTIAITAITLLAVLALIASSLWWARQRTIDNLANTMADLATNLATSDPPLASQYALTALQLRTTPRTEEAARTVATANWDTLIEKQVSSNDIRGLALANGTVFVQDSGGVRMWSWPDLEPLGKLQSKVRPDSIVSCAAGLLYTLQNNNLVIYNVHRGEAPTLYRTLKLKYYHDGPIECVPDSGDAVILGRKLTVNYYSDSHNSVRSTDLSTQTAFQNYRKPLSWETSSGFSRRLRIDPPNDPFYEPASTRDYHVTIVGVPSQIFTVKFGFYESCEEAWAKCGDYVTAEWRYGSPSNVTVTALGFLPEANTDSAYSNVVIGTPNGIVETSGARLHPIDSRVNEISSRVAPGTGMEQYAMVRTDGGVHVFTQDGRELFKGATATGSGNVATAIEPGVLPRSGDPAWLVGHHNGHLQVLARTSPPGAKNVTYGSQGGGVLSVGRDGSVLQGNTPMSVATVRRSHVSDATVSIYDTPAGDSFYFNAFDADENFLAGAGESSQGGTVVVWEGTDSPPHVLVTPDTTPRPTDRPDILPGVILDAKNKTVTAYSGRTEKLYVWSLTTWTLIATQPAPQSAQQAAGVTGTRDGSRVAYQNGTAVSILDTTNGLREVARLSVLSTKGALSPDGATFAQPSDNGIRLTAVDSGTTRSFTNFELPPTNIAWDAEGKRLAAWSLQGSDAIVLDASTGARISTFVPTASGDLTAEAGFSGDQLLVQYAAHDNSSSYTPTAVLAYPASQAADYTAKLCNISRTPLSSDRWRALAGDLSQPRPPC